MAERPLENEVHVPGYDEFVEIGRGSSAVVYRARQLSVNRQVAIKVIRAMDVDDRAWRRFERERLAMGALSWHPHIVGVHDAGTTPAGQPYIAMEFLEGGSLANRLDRKGRFAWPQVTSIGIQIAGALEAAHREQVLHRDVKPRNILIGKLGEVKLADFGIAAFVANASASALRQPAATLAHVAPEVLMEGRPTVLSDVYSLGSTLFTLLAGQPAFVDDTDTSLATVIGRISSAELPDPSGFGAPKPLAEVIRRAMQRDPTARPGSALELGLALQQVQQVLEVAVTELAVGEDSLDPPTIGDGRGTVQIDFMTLPSLPGRDPEATADRTTFDPSRSDETVPVGELQPQVPPPSAPRPSSPPSLEIQLGPSRPTGEVPVVEAQVEPAPVGDEDPPAAVDPPDRRRWFRRS